MWRDSRVGLHLPGRLHSSWTERREIVIVTRLPILVSLALLSACASTTPVQPAASSKSKFEGAAYTGETVTLAKPTPGEESYRLFQQAATGFVSMQSVRSTVEERATAHCDRQGRTMRGLEEKASKPPYILGNFPKLELVFECVNRSAVVPSAAPGTKYERIETLKRLLDGGALTQQEFDREKAKVLAEP